jgi:hypothetical protein
MNKSSWTSVRSRLSALLTAGWLNPTRRAARETFRSAISASNTSSKLRSIPAEFEARIMPFSWIGNGQINYPPGWTD